ncbi:uncharacterized protein F5147DRAFT_812390 [Suillus discolor]|uniref:Uncharacterized protein n=1 Tax=Suillus discolor TaxID=1912936 RepID=A0A9P7JQX2_9AGAM|nr:uncharacterized protein F5147DRAFT_812390 [Suillus discolor]KAG2101390.1 hypothetical protein F5147DRAFT_812390 [Suillus discolor]
MPPFTAAMLNATPSPEPEPVAQGHPEDAPMADASAESNTDRLLSAWASSLVSLEACVMAAPDLKPELLEDQEMWMREWHSVLATLNGCSERAGVLGVELDMDEKGAEFLKQGRKGCKEIEALVKGWKAKAIETVPEAPPKRAARATDATGAEARATDASGTDVAEQRKVGRMSVVKAPRCTSCANKDQDCGGAPGRRCPPCDVSKRACSFSKRKTSDGPKVRPRKPMPKRPMAVESAKETASSIAVEEGEGSEGSGMDVMIVDERTVQDKVVRASRDVPVRAVGPLASGSAPKGKGKFKGPEEELKEAQAETARLREENALMRASALKMRQYARAQQADLLALSNKLFSMSQDWSDFEERVNASLN